MRLALFWQPAPAPAQQKEKVYRRISTEQVEKLFDALDLDYFKRKDKKTPNTYFYEYNPKYKVILGYYDGTHLWLSANFERAAPEVITSGTPMPSLPGRSCLPTWKKSRPRWRPSWIALAASPRECCASSWCASTAS